MKAELAREPESIRTMKKEGGQISNLSPRRARPVSCKCPACGRMRTVKMIPPKSGITPRIYCPKHIRRRFVDTDCDPLLGTYAVGW